MDLDVAIEATVQLMPQYQAFCEHEYAEWSKTNKPPFIAQFPWDVNKFFDAWEDRRRNWHDHMTSRSIAWWSERGYVYEKKGPYAKGTLTHEPSGMCLCD